MRLHRLLSRIYRYKLNTCGFIGYGNRIQCIDIFKFLLDISNNVSEMPQYSVYKLA